MGRCIIRTSKIGYFNSTTIVSSKEKVSDYLKENIYYSISGYTYAPPFMQMYEQIVLIIFYILVTIHMFL